jgi:myosin heavy subunit
VPTINDVADFKTVVVDSFLNVLTIQKGMDVLGFSSNERMEIWKVLSAILLLGNVRFEPATGQFKVKVENRQGFEFSTYFDRQFPTKLPIY